MIELSLHILDIVQNSIHAGASKIDIELSDNLIDDTYKITITDNGTGMDSGTMDKLNDPFYTTKNKKTGMGIPLLRQHAEATQGSLSIESEKGKGTRVQAMFNNSHYDRQPLGDIAGTITSIIMGSPEIHFGYTHWVDNECFNLSTIEVEKELDGIPVSNPKVLAFIRDMINSNIEELQKQRNISNKNKQINTNNYGKS